MPIHPLCGQQLRVVGPAVVKAGKRYLTVEHPKGRRLRIPEAWSDRMVALPAPTVNGQVVRLAGKALLRLSRAVAACLDKKLDKAPIGERLPTGPEHRGSHGAVDESANRSATVVHFATTSTGPDVVSAGESDAQGASMESVFDGGRR